jgi:hypothetical protein
VLDTFTALTNALRDAGGWVAFGALALLISFALIRGWLVPGYVYEREVKRGDRAEDAVDASTKTTEQAALATKLATETALSVASQFGRLRELMERGATRESS